MVASNVSLIQKFLCNYNVDLITSYCIDLLPIKVPKAIAIIMA